MNTTTTTKPGGSSAFLGMLAIIMGIVAMMSPGLTGLSVVLLVGIAVMVGGIVRMLWALRAGSFGKGMLTFALGALTLVCGGVLIAHPLFTAGILTVMLALYFVADGVTEIIAALKVRPVSGWGLLLFSGIVSIMLGVIIWRQYPLSGLWATGILLGIKLFFVGLVMVAAPKTPPAKA